MSEKLLAYCVRELGDGTGGIVFAKSNAQARREGSSEFADGDFHSVEAHREQWADEYSPGPVPKKAMMEAGWWFECDGCGFTISEDNCSDRGSDFEEIVGSSLDYVIEVGCRVFCTGACRDQYIKDGIKKEQAKKFTIEAMKHRVYKRFGDVEFTTGEFRQHAYITRVDGVLRAQQCVVSFNFPGQKIAPASYRFDKVGEEPHFHCCNGDREAFLAFSEATRPAPQGRE